MMVVWLTRGPESESRHMRYSAVSGPSWLCSAGTEHRCGGHMGAEVVDGVGVPL